MQKVFISYRRDDSGPIAGRVQAQLRRVLPRGHVFFDVSEIKGGQKFEKRIRDSIDHADCVFVFVGKHWLSKAADSDRLRICEPNDYVRLELACALEQNKSIIPILIDGTQMPNADLLPDDIKHVTKIHALQLRHTTFDADLDSITLDALGFKLSDTINENRRLLWRKLPRALAGGIGSLALCLIGALAHRLALGVPISVSIGHGGTTLLLVSAVVFGTYAGWTLGARKHRPNHQ